MPPLSNRAPRDNGDAGRTRVFELMPLTLSELTTQIDLNRVPIQDLLLTGGYPRIWDQDLSPTNWHKEYFRLLGITESKQLDVHPLRGSTFENFIVSELVKKEYHQGHESRYYFWRDQKGHEVDVLHDNGTVLYPIEIKLSQTFQQGFIDQLVYFNKLQMNQEAPLGSVYSCVESSFEFQEYKIQNWIDLSH